MCLNFVEYGTCHVDGRKCLLGPRGAVSKNEDRECELHGAFDVWLVGHSILVTDLGQPVEEPAQDLALGVNENTAMSVAEDRSREYGMPIVAGKRSCIQCGDQYWISQHTHASALAQNSRAHLCPKCISTSSEVEIARKLGEQRQWCG